MSEVLQASKEQLIDYLWSVGDLKYKCRPHQVGVYEHLRDNMDIMYVLNISRRFGKSTLLLMSAVSDCILYPGCTIPYVAPTQKMVSRIIHPLMKVILKDAPKDLCPQWNIMEGAYVFPNDSRIFIAGTEKKQYESMRGIDAVRAYVDEGGFCEELKYIVHDILTPATMTHDGQIIIASTPPKTPAHDFFFLCEDARSRGNYMKKTIEDNDWLTVDQKKKYIDEAGGPGATTCKREYFCEFVVNSRKRRRHTLSENGPGPRTMKSREASTRRTRTIRLTLSGITISLMRCMSWKVKYSLTRSLLILLLRVCVRLKKSYLKRKGLRGSRTRSGR
jgi:hypothetical protein